MRQPRGHERMPRTARGTTLRTPDSPPAGAMSNDFPTVSPILSPELNPLPGSARHAITAGWIRDEATHVRELLAQAALPDADRAAAQATAADLVRRVRARARDQGA